MTIALRRRSRSSALMALVATALSLGAPLGLPGTMLAQEGSASVVVAPARSQINPDAVARIDLRLSADVETAGIVVDLEFDTSIIQITSVEPGEAWSQAAFMGGTAEAIAEANESGLLSQAGVLLPGSTVPAGDAVFLVIMATALADGTTTVTLTGAAVVGPLGDALSVSLQHAELVVGTGAGDIGDSLDNDLLWIVGLVLVGLLLGGIGVVTWRMRNDRQGRRPRQRQATSQVAVLRNWPFALSLVLGLIPVVLFAGMVAMLVVNSLPVLDRPGLDALNSDRFASRFTTGEGAYGLHPALWGTVLIAGIAIGLALPVSLAMAIIATEFPMGPLGRVLRPLLGVLSGIPPVVYAASAVVFVTLFMIPKFAAESVFSTFDPARLGIAPEDWPPADVPWNAGAFPWDPAGINNSTLLGGALIALLVIPFMTPLIVDAVRTVPSTAREASLALGANRGHTLRKVILPAAMPGIVTSLALGTLKALGDTLIVVFVVGWEANVIPDPVVDVLERTPSLAALGSGLVGGFLGSGVCRVPQCSVGYASAFVLLVVAAVVVLATSVLHARSRRGVWG